MAKCPWPVVVRCGYRYRVSPGGTEYLDDVKVVRLPGGYQVHKGDGYGQVGLWLSNARARKLVKLLKKAGLKA